MKKRGVFPTGIRCRHIHAPPRPFFPHGFSATEPLVPRSKDGSTPITDALPRSIFLDPTTYKPRRKLVRKEIPYYDPQAKLSDFELAIRRNPFGISYLAF
jgi:hypothetical protein